MTVMWTSCLGFSRSTCAYSQVRAVANASVTGVGCVRGLAVPVACLVVWRQQKVRTGNQPNAFAAIRNLVTGAFRHAGYANIAQARRWHGRDDQRILVLYGYI